MSCLGTQQQRGPTQAPTSWWGMQPRLGQGQLQEKGVNKGQSNLQRSFTRGAVPSRQREQKVNNTEMEMAVRNLSSWWHFRWQHLVRRLCSFLGFCKKTKLGASMSSYVATVISDLLSEELPSEQPPSGEGLEEPVGQGVLVGSS